MTYFSIKDFTTQIEAKIRATLVNTDEFLPAHIIQDSAGNEILGAKTAAKEVDPDAASASIASLIRGQLKAQGDILAKLIAAPATEAKQDVMITALGGLHTDLATTLAPYLDGLEGLIGTSNAALANILTGITTTLAGYVDGLETLVGSSNTKLDTLHTDIATTLVGYVDGLETLLGDLKTYTDGLETLVTSSNTKLDTIHTDLGTTLSGLLTDLKGYTDQLEGYVDGLEGLVTSTNSKLDTLALAQAPVAPATATATKALLAALQYNSAGISPTDGQQFALQSDAKGGLGVAGLVASGATDAGNPVKVAGIFTTTQPTFSDGQRGNISISARGYLMASSVSTNSFSDGASANTSLSVGNASTLVGVANGLYNGSNFDRARSVINATNSTGTGIAAAGLVAQLDDVSPTAITENQFGNVRMNTARALYHENGPYLRGRATADAQISAAAGFVHTITVSPLTAAPTAGLLTVYDSTTESGTVLHSEWVAAGVQVHTVLLDMPVSTGIYVGFDATLANVGVEVAYR